MASAGPKVPASWNSSKPHPDPRREAFAKSVALGSSYINAYKAHIGKDAQYDSIKSSAYKVATHEQPVIDRIIWWRQEFRNQLEIPEQLDGVMLKDLLIESVNAIQSAYQAAEASGCCNPIELTRISALTTRIIGRFSRNAESDNRPPKQDFKPDLGHIKYCNCAPDSEWLVGGPKPQWPKKAGGASALIPEPELELCA